MLSTLFFPDQAFVLQSVTAFNRWLMIENALAAEIPRLLVPEKSDAKTKKKTEGTLAKVEKRAEFMVLILDHFLLYLAVVSKMKDETTSLPGDQEVLRAALRKRAVDMAKTVLPHLAVMWEKAVGQCLDDALLPILVRRETKRPNGVQKGLVDVPQ